MTPASQLVQTAGHLPRASLIYPGSLLTSFHSILLPKAKLRSSRHTLSAFGFNDQAASPFSGHMTSRIRLFSASTSSVEVSNPSVVDASTSIPSLEELAAMIGPGSGEIRLSHTTERLFGSNEEPRVIFYRDNSSWCPYCERVWIQLEEKKIPYRVEKINMRCYGPKPDWFLKMVPSGLLPVVKLDGRVITESLDIMFALEVEFSGGPYTPLLPPKGTAQLSAVPRLLRLERRVAGAWLDWSTRGGGMFFSSGGQTKFEEALDAVDVALKEFGGPYFLGEELSLVDAVFAPFLERIAASIPFWKGLTVRNNGRWPTLDAWFDAMDSRPIYQAIKSDDFTITHTLEPQIGPVEMTRPGTAYRALIEGTVTPDPQGVRGSSWDLPLGPETTAWGFDDGKHGKEEAVRQFLERHDEVVNFALRALKGEEEEHREAVSAAFRHMLHGMAKEGGVQAIGPLPQELRGDAVAKAVGRVCVGVPRDLTYPAARQLRAHLRWLKQQALGSSV